MDRATVYTQEQGRSVDFLFAQRATMIGLAKLAQGAFGSNTVVHGLAVTPNSPAALNVLVGIGEIYTMAQVDATTWGSLGADTTDIILKQGLNMSAQTISTPAPTTSGYSINYLIEAQYQDQDTNPVLLPFFNSSNPQEPLNGQGGNGATLPTQRQGVCVIQAKAGVAATTGTQVTPTVDSGWTALAVVTVANGQSTVTSGNISVPNGVPQITSLLQMMQTGSTAYAVDTSTTANQIVLALTPPITAYTDGQEFTFKAANSNIGPCTINAGPGAVNFIGVAGAFQGGEIIAGRQYTGIYSASLNEVVLNSQTAGAQQVNPATQPAHAVQFSQISGVVGAMRNAKMSIATASATGSWSADEFVVESALGGLRYCIGNVSGSINLGSVGAGGMDVGTPPASGFVAIYGIYNPTGQTFNLLAANATSSVAPNVYAGGHLPAGYTASALIAVWPTTGGGQFAPGFQFDRNFYSQPSAVLSTNTQQASFTALSIAGAAPLNAKTASGYMLVSSTSSGTNLGQIASTSTALGSTELEGSGTTVSGQFSIALLTPQTLYYTATVGAGTMTASVAISSYSI